MTIIIILLNLIALYTGGMWLYLGFQTTRRGIVLERDEAWNYERHTFHLGLCCILALGFLGLIVK